MVLLLIRTFYSWFLGVEIKIKMKDGSMALTLGPFFYFKIWLLCLIYLLLKNKRFQGHIKFFYVFKEEERAPIVSTEKGLDQ